MGVKRSSTVLSCSNQARRCVPRTQVPNATLTCKAEKDRQNDQLLHHCYPRKAIVLVAGGSRTVCCGCFSRWGSRLALQVLRTMGGVEGEIPRVNGILRHNPSLSHARVRTQHFVHQASQPPSFAWVAYHPLRNDSLHHFFSSFSFFFGSPSSTSRIVLIY